MTNKSVLALIFALTAAAALKAAAPFVVVVTDLPGMGFNDATPVAPVGGNSGTTIGEQRLIAMQHAASIWSAKLESPMPIRVRVSFEPLECDDQHGRLGVGRVTAAFRYTGTGSDLIPNVWYPVALANKLAERVLAPESEEIEIKFNSDIGRPNCISRLSWYYGLDTRATTAQADLVETALHELAHGLGFGPTITGENFEKFNGSSDVFSQYLLDVSTGKMWGEMSDEERAASAVNTRHVVWNGINGRSDALKVLQRGAAPTLRISEPKSVARDYYLETAAFGSRVGSPAVGGQLIAAVDEANAAGPSTTDGCSILLNGSEVAGRIALVDRGTCTFVQKARNAQAAGAIGLVVVNNAAGLPTPLLGTDPEISIPVVHVSQVDGRSLRAALASEKVTGKLEADPDMLAGADETGRPFVFAPYPDQRGSSISHWDPGVRPSQLMQPNIAEDLTQSVEPPRDLTLSVLKDEGWLSDYDGVPDGIDECPGSDRHETVVIQSCDTGVSNVIFVNGCRISDYLKACTDRMRNSGSFAACVGLVSKTMRSQGAIGPQDQEKMQACAVPAPRK